MANEEVVRDVSKQNDSRSTSTSLLAGAIAGLIVDVTLFPLDTLKTRLQSQYGFWRSGGFYGVYKGVGTIAVGSAPCAAVFFASYNYIKDVQYEKMPELLFPVGHMLCASVSEVAACVIKVPLEIVKQRRQAIEGAGHPFRIIGNTLKREGFLGMYRGFGTTVIRDIPFSAIQFPIWEALKTQWRESSQREISPWEVSLCGAIAGGIAGAATTPLDVAKTRIMLAEQSANTKTPSFVTVLIDIYKTSGMKGLFAGFIPRIVWIFLGGGIFFGIYEKAARIIDDVNNNKNTKLNTY
ncbi:mitochondrial S-adenosylmethionine carrier protein [Lycorma delicatula]|uniref:mitochondrial S-adenosylmethionine carrier protein n=1 Tax=Lycorma delicatula TaxID=130591 RepID=UPI003F518859